MKLRHFPIFCRSCAFVLGLGLAGLILALPARLVAAGEERFNTPEAAVNALTAAVKAGDTNAMHAIFGPAGHELVSPDVVQKTEEYQAFAQRLTNKVDLVRESD
ncbi:MAG TPA: DUF2950 family protein, partial [Verrucomicrobiae bacterium]|nr:DUF2950 family protein [Verrucomicrobiae bacterium]